MHYSNGRPAKAYNIKHEIVGLLVFANPAANACNCQVATVTKGSQVLHNAIPAPEPDPNGAVFFKGFNPPSFHSVVATLEYGQLDAFLAIDPNTGDVLPAES